MNGLQSLWGDRQTDEQIDRQTDRHTNTHACMMTFSSYEHNFKKPDS